MFESLSERIKEDERGTVNNTQRTIFWVGIFVVVAAVLYVAVTFGMKLSQ
jgi:signal transduction histidine kinase